jgi:hypothetical protein
LIKRDEHGNALNRAHRRRFLLSGLLACGSCGGAYTIVGQDRYGCATRRSKGTCSNALLIGRKEIEERVLGGLRERMMAPELVAIFVEEFNAELRRRAVDAEADYAVAHRAIAEADRKIASIVRAIEDGAYSPMLIGSEGVVGLPALLGRETSGQHVIVQAPLAALRMDAADCRTAFDQSAAVRQVLLRYTATLLDIASQTAACNRLHSLKERCARWILMMHDRLQADAMPLTQEFFAMMLRASSMIRR